MQNEIIHFEHPLNECMRICLRLEHLFHQFDSNIDASPFSTEHSRMAIDAVLEILNVIDRPDLKSRLAQTLTQNASTLSQLQPLPHVNQHHLHEILAKLDPLIDELHKTHSKIADPLRNNDFLNSVRMQIHNPGGLCDFALPVFALWLAQSAEHRQQQLKAWYREFNLLSDITHIILELTRNSTLPEKIIAVNGFYQRTLNPLMPGQMVRISLSAAHKLYPELSIGKHRMSIRFLETHYLDGKRRTHQEDVEFELSCCRI